MFETFPALFVHEATVDERTILELHLSPNHPILRQLNARLRIPLTTAHEMVL